MKYLKEGLIKQRGVHWQPGEIVLYRLNFDTKMYQNFPTWEDLEKFMKNSQKSKVFKELTKHIIIQEEMSTTFEGSLYSSKTQQEIWSYLDKYNGTMDGLFYGAAYESGLSDSGDFEIIFWSLYGDPTILTRN